MSNQVLEVLTYSLTPQMSADRYLALVATTAPVFAALPGLLSRTLAHQDGTWTEVAHWASQGDADAAGQTIMANPAVAPLMAALDMASLSMRFVPILWHNPG